MAPDPQQQRQQGDAFVRTVLKGDPTPVTTRDAVQWFRQKGGSARGAEKVSGISRSTLARAEAGRSRPATVERILSAYRTARSSPSKMGDAGVILKLASAEVRRPDRGRDVWGAQLQLAPGTLDAATQTWVATGDSSAALRTFLDGVQEPWYRTQLALGTGNDDLLPGDWTDHAMESDYGVTIG